jgi:hypothetical protein
VLILRFVGLFTALFLVGLGVGYVLTKDKRYLRIAWRTVQVVGLLFVAFMLLYVFERVLLVV